MVPFENSIEGKRVGVKVTGIGSNIFDESNPECLVRKVSSLEIADDFQKHEHHFREMFNLIRKLRSGGKPFYLLPEWQELNFHDQIATLLLDQKYPGNSLPQDNDPRWVQFEAPVDKIISKSGIKNRYWARPGIATSDLGAQAARRALTVSGLNPEKIGFIIVATTTPDFLATPSTANVIKKKLGIQNEDVACKDISSACTSFANALEAGYAYISSGLYKSGMVIGADVEESTTSPFERSVRILLATGGFCMILEACEPEQSEFDSKYFYLGSDSNYSDLIVVPAGGSALATTPEMFFDPFDQRIFMKMDGAGVRKQAERQLLHIQKNNDGSISNVSGAIHKALIKAGLKYSDIDFGAFHQANMRIILPTAENMRRLGFRGQIYNNIENFGNTTSASVGLCLDHAWQLGLLKPKMLVFGVTIGGGLTWGIFIIRWMLDSFPEQDLPYSFDIANMPAFAA